MKRWYPLLAFFRLVILVLLFIYVLQAHAQAPPYQTTVTGTVMGTDGHLATSGKVQFDLRPYSQAANYRIVNNYVIGIATKITCAIDSSGHIMDSVVITNPCMIWGNDMITPQNTTYTVTYFPNGTQTQTVPQVYITGATYDLSCPTFVPVNNVLPPEYSTLNIPPINASVIPEVNNLFWFGTQDKMYAGGYWHDLYLPNQGRVNWRSAENDRYCGIFFDGDDTIYMGPCGLYGTVLKYTNSIIPNTPPSAFTYSFVDQVKKQLCTKDDTGLVLCLGSSGGVTVITNNGGGNGNPTINFQDTPRVNNWTASYDSVNHVTTVTADASQTVQEAGAVIGTRHQSNFLNTGKVQFTATDNPGNDSVDISATFDQQPVNWAPPPPVVVPNGQGVAWAYPTTCSVTGTAGLGSEMCGVSSGTLVRTVSCPLCDQYLGLAWTGFTMPTLPNDAVIQNIYGVIVAKKLASGTIDSVVTMVCGGNTFFNAGGNFAGEFHSGTIGTTPATVTGATCSLTTNSTLNFSVNDNINIQLVAIAIYYTSANVPIYDSGLILVPQAQPSNFTAPTHQFVTGYNQTSTVFSSAQPADADIAFTDVTTGNVSTSAHGYAPKAPNDATKYLDGTGAWSTPKSGLVLLEQHTASASASLDFTTSISATYDEYMIEFVNVVPATNAQTFEMKVSTDGGSTWVGGTAYTTSRLYWGQGDTVTGVATASAAYFALAGSVQTTANYSVNGSIKLFNPGGSAYKFISGQTLSASASGSNLYIWNLSGAYADTTAVNAFQFLFASGNIASGTIRVYGVAK